VGVGFFQDLGHGVDDVVHGFLGFGFGGLDQEALGHQQREVDGGGVLVVVEQALGDVERGDVVVLGLFGEGEDEFVAGAALRVGGLAADGFEALEQVVGGEGGVFADADHAFAAEHHGVEVGAQEDAGVAHEGAEVTGPRAVMETSLVSALHQFQRVAIIF